MLPHTNTGPPKVSFPQLHARSSQILIHTQHVQVLIIGGGPAGSYAASALAREGLDVAVFEADKFPRYHVGESLIPSVRHYFRYIGAEEVLCSQGFVSKPGSAIKFNQFKREGYTDFVALGCHNNSWNVVRSEFDQLLMNHARASGASVYELTKVQSVSFSATDPTRPVSVDWTHIYPPSPLSPPASPTTIKDSFDTDNHRNSNVPASITGTTTFAYLIDASGRAGIMSTKYLKNRHFNMSLKNVAVWGYWSDVGRYGIGTSREGAPWFEALTDESGWAWFIPLHNGTTSVGIVMNQTRYNETLNLPLSTLPFALSATPNPANSTTTARYISNLSLAPGIVKLISSTGKMQPLSIKSASDFSYSASLYAGPNFRIVGDAGSFIDPFFSSGIHLALTSALSAAATICASIRNDCPEHQAAEWHTRRVSTSYTRFQVVVLSAYKQIRAQSIDILSDIDEDNYDRAFGFLRPLIQGASDMGTRLSETELQKSLDFCVNLFNPTSPEDHERLLKSGGIGKELLDVTGPLVNPAMFEASLHVGTRRLSNDAGNFKADDLGCDPDSVEKMILDKINARRVVHPEYAINNLEAEPLEGFVMRLEKGKLGLTDVTIV
ncbi:hypothetical protein BDZ94DRAFT_1169211 [Collybia nuda]|uniref:Halogenase n=1 Tax=Collybia nuda TaxID=64659 RepID=A0A9P5Y1T7_9AGAR|nr:hypothetical protein BDZ94DRAFT_1169211 [Collybia nuda]